MFSIGDFARHGRVSVRMLRHYDALGLLQPARVDPGTGYRFYAAAQLPRLNRIIALKELGFTLQQVQAILDEQVSAEQLRGMLMLRRAELRDQIADDTARLARVEARLRTIESEGTMPDIDVVIKRVPAIRVAALSAPCASYEPDDIGPALSPLYPDLMGRMDRAGISIIGAPIAYYEDSPDDDGTIVVHAAFPVEAEPGTNDGFEILDLPEIETAATVVHRGPMDGVGPTGQALAQWVDAHGYRSIGYARELYLEVPMDDQDKWVTELQQPVSA